MCDHTSVKIIFTPSPPKGFFFLHDIAYLLWYLSPTWPKKKNPRKKKPCVCKIVEHTLGLCCMRTAVRTRTPHVRRAHFFRIRCARVRAEHSSRVGALIQQSFQFSKKKKQWRFAQTVATQPEATTLLQQFIYKKRNSSSHTLST